MTRPLDIAFFGSSLVSAYWNGAATYYRGIIRALATKGHRVTFYEPDAYERQQHRDIDDPPWCNVVVYDGKDEDAPIQMLERAKSADVLVKASGVGVFDELLEAAILAYRRPGALAVFWDVDAPATLDRVRSNPNDPFRALIPKYDLVFTYGGGKPVVRGYTGFGAKRCVPIYNALDPDVHHPVAPDDRFACDVAFLGNRLPDREARVEEFFLKPARALSERAFLLGGNGWHDKPLPSNVRNLGHVATADHNAFNCTPLVTLNIARDSMAKCGWSPATRVFEAAGAAACMISDAWEGIEEFLEPDREILVAKSGDEVTEIVRNLSPRRARAIGLAARRRVLADHTYSRRALEVISALAPHFPFLTFAAVSP